MIDARFVTCPLIRNIINMRKSGASIPSLAEEYIKCRPFFVDVHCVGTRLQSFLLIVGIRFSTGTVNSAPFR